MEGGSQPRTRLGRARVARHVSQAALARATGISPRTIQRLEQGEVPNPPIRYLTNCAIALGVPLTELIETEWEAWTVFDARTPTPPPEDWWADPEQAGTWGRSPYGRALHQQPETAPEPDD